MTMTNRNPADIVMARIEELAHFTCDPPRVTRLFLSPEHKQAIGRVIGWMEEAGMSARLDAIGNVHARYEGETPDAPALILGSHIDTVRDAGKYDGNLGVLTAIAAVDEFNRQGRRFPFAIEVVAFGDEEGSRFPSTLSGSRALAGRFDPAMLEVKDPDGVTMREALAAFGCDPAAIPALAIAPQRALAFVELHIEQGPVLEALDLPVGIVTAINGATRFQVEVSGMAGHAGTVPMNGRRDALSGAAEMILATEQRAQAEEHLVATVGRVSAEPGAVNVIPGLARFTLDIRAPSDEQRLAAVLDIEAACRRIADSRGLGLTMIRNYDEEAALCHPAIVEALSQSVAREGHRVHRLPSGAGHDTMAIEKLCPVGMIFVRCKGGISHNPAESITIDDAAAGFAVLVDFIRHFDPAALRRA